ncbi:hypothetical protein GBS0709_19820 [Edwardsiella tarda]|nr:hypothetical protein GBS0709_19820 [Edwardsiella tarda]
MQHGTLRRAGSGGKRIIIPAKQNTINLNDLFCLSQIFAALAVAIPSGSDYLHAA